MPTIQPDLATQAIQAAIPATDILQVNNSDGSFAYALEVTPQVTADTRSIDSRIAVCQAAQADHQQKIDFIQEEIDSLNASKQRLLTPTKTVTLPAPDPVVLADPAQPITLGA